MIATEERTLPALAWLWALPAPGGEARLHHGSGIVTRCEAFFEGAWEGPFDAFGFDVSANVFGSGGKRRADGWLFVPPSHTLESLYVWQLGQTSVVSNSLPFLLTYCGDELEPFDWTYGERFCSIVLGLQHTPVVVPVQRGKLIVVHHHNLAISTTGDLRLEPKTLPPRFDDYAGYIGYLQATITAVFRNAAAVERPRRYQPLCTLSAGYDSPACAVLARAAGCREAVTLNGRQLGEDSGTAIARHLGLAIKVVPIETGGDGDCPEAEFLATGMQGEDLVYQAFAAELAGRLLLTGFHGDKVWEKTIAPSPDIKRGDVSGSSLGEFRLARDFIHLPVPFIGCRRHDEIWRISNSSAMSAYSVGGDYDRPIARRLVESAGVPRTAFAQVKRAASRHAFLDPSLLGAAARREMADFPRTQGTPLGAQLRYQAGALRWQLGMLAVRLGRTLRRAYALAPQSGGGRLPDRRSGAFRKLFGTDFAVFEHSHPRTSVWLRWAVGRMGARYRCAGMLERAGQHGGHSGGTKGSSPAPLEQEGRERPGEGMSDS